MRIFWIAGLTLLTLLPALGEQIYVRNRPYTGPAEGRGATLAVGLKEMATLVDLEVQDKDGGFVIGEAPTKVGAGEVFVNGSKLEASAGPMVLLKEFAAAAGLTYRYNKDLDSIDVTLGRKAVTGTSGPSAPNMASEGHGNILVINKSTPGASFEARGLGERGKWCFFLWYNPSDKDPGYRKTFFAMDAFAKYTDCVVYKINVGAPDSPLNKQYPGNVPRVVVQDPAGRDRSYWNGHSILDKAAHSDQTIAELRGRK